MSVLPERAALFDDLRRRPDLEALELRAWDAADALMLDEAAALGDLAGTAPVVIGDTHGAITLGALAAGASSVRTHTDALAGERALGLNAAELGVDPERIAVHPALAPELVAEARLVLLRLPRTLAALDEVAALIAAHAHPEVIVVAAGRIKHMTPAQTELLRARFARVDVTHARQKSRALIAREPRSATDAPPAPQPERTSLPAAQLGLPPGTAGLDVVALPGAFAGAKLDIGTRALLAVLADAPEAARAIDLGCGTGILAATLARHQPRAVIVASDQSAAAVGSALLTMAANGLDADGRVTVTRDDALSAEADGGADLVLLNPPFHSGAAVHHDTATRLFEAAARVLRPGGELWCVWNSSLGYRPRLERIVGPTRQLSRSPKFTVTASIRRG